MGRTDPAESDAAEPHSSESGHAGSGSSGADAHASDPRGADPRGADPGPDASAPAGIRRRALLTGGAAGAGLGAVLGAALGFTGGRASAPQSSADPVPFGADALACHGKYQPGVTATPPAFVRFVAYRLKPDTDRAAIERMFRILTGDVEGLTSGVAPLADPEPELAVDPANLTITVGVGPELVNRVDPARRPEWLAPLPEFTRDRLSGDFDGGDLLLLLQADDPLPIAHAARMLHRDLRTFGEQLWTQPGFRRARGATSDGTTMRNLMGQVDGTENPNPKADDFGPLVWIDDEGSTGWLAGGTSLVLRRIRMELDEWDQIDRPGREETIGRTVADGAPLTGGTEFTPVDFDAKAANGLPVIPSFAHIRRAHATTSEEQIFRRSANYDDDGESGLLFACYQRDPETQYVPIQKRLDELDLLNEWITHVGSAVFAILPGFTRGEMIGASLLA